ncbi:hypothetical protein Dimus_039111 [Dionaea muscipula]
MRGCPRAEEKMAHQPASSSRPGEQRALVRASSGLDVGEQWPREVLLRRAAGHGRAPVLSSEQPSSSSRARWLASSGARWLASSGARGLASSRHK